MALGIVALELICCLGLGAAILRLLKIDDELTPGEHAIFAFAAGFGALGWLVFPLGIWGLLDKSWLLGLLLAGSSGVVLIRRKGWPRPARPDNITWILSALILLVLLLDLAEGLSPPGDADSLAYHFTAIKHFLDAGRIIFILRPGDGSIPYLTQMTYLPVLALGGERALTLWTMVSGWAPAALLFAICRHHLNQNWSLAVTLIFLTTPAMIYGAGTGQIEARLAMFVLLAAWATARGRETGRLNYVIFAGLATGFYGGSKYLGLLFAAACGLTLLAQRRWLIHGLTFSAAALVAGFQWYAWNGIHTGDPFFPMFFQWLGRDDLLLWSKEQNLFYQQVFMNYDRPLPRTPLWFLLFPFQATLNSPPIIEAKAVGLGPFAFLILPFAAMGVWRFRHRILGSRLLVYGTIAFLFYAIWFFSGPSQRVRHLLPVLPLLLICLTAAAERLSPRGQLRRPLTATVAAVIFFQIFVDVIFSVKYLRHVASGENRESFLLKNVKHYAPVPWINAHLSQSDKLFIGERQLLYFLKVPYLFSSSATQSAVNTREDQKDPVIMFKQLQTAGITHVLGVRSDGEEKKLSPTTLELLSRTNCLTLLNRFDADGIGSRTFSQSMSSKTMIDLLALNDAACMK